MFEELYCVTFPEAILKGITQGWLWKRWVTSKDGPETLGLFALHWLLQAPQETPVSSTQRCDCRCTHTPRETESLQFLFSGHSGAVTSWGDRTISYFVLYRLKPSLAEYRITLQTRPNCWLTKADAPSEMSGKLERKMMAKSTHPSQGGRWKR